MQPVSGEEYKEFFTTTGMDIDGRMAYWRKVSANISIFVKMMIRFAHKVPGFTDLSLRDQTSLIKGVEHVENVSFFSSDTCTVYCIYSIYI